MIRVLFFALVCGLVACAPADVAEVLANFRRDGFDRAAEIGEIVAGPPRVVVR